MENFKKYLEQREKRKMMFTLWDIGHGLAIWIKTPNGHNHWIDAGKNNDTDFCPAEHVKTEYGETALDYLIISHPDSDHIHNLPSVIHNLGEPRVLLRNKTVPDTDKYGNGESEYQKVFKDLDTRYTSSITEEKSPKNPAYNGGVFIENAYLNYKEGMKINDTSIVILYLYAGWLFICPGDIEEKGWKELWQMYSKRFQPILDKSKYRILVAPHHGRSSGYCSDMIDAISPHWILISDKYGKEPTDQRFREKGIGLRYKDNTAKFFSTKSGGRMQFCIYEGSRFSFNQT